MAAKRLLDLWGWVNTELVAARPFANVVAGAISASVWQFVCEHGHRGDNCTLCRVSSMCRHGPRGQKCKRIDLEAWGKLNS